MVCVAATARPPRCTRRLRRGTPPPRRRWARAPAPPPVPHPPAGAAGTGVARGGDAIPAATPLPPAVTRAASVAAVGAAGGNRGWRARRWRRAPPTEATRRARARSVRLAAAERSGARAPCEGVAAVGGEPPLGRRGPGDAAARGRLRRPSTYGAWGAAERGGRVAGCGLRWGQTPPPVRRLGATPQGWASRACGTYRCRRRGRRRWGGRPCTAPRAGASRQRWRCGSPQTPRRMVPSQGREHAAALGGRAAAARGPDAPGSARVGGRRGGGGGTRWPRWRHLCGRHRCCGRPSMGGRPCSGPRSTAVAAALLAAGAAGDVADPWGGTPPHALFLPGTLSRGGAPAPRAGGSGGTVDDRRRRPYRCSWQRAAAYAV